MADRLLKFFECHKPGSCEHFSYFMCWNEPFARRTLDGPGLMLLQRYMPPDRRAIITRAIIVSNTDCTLYARPPCTLYKLYSSRTLQLRHFNNASSVQKNIVGVGGHVRICVCENLFVISRARRSHKFLASAVVVVVVVFFSCTVGNLCWISLSKEKPMENKNFYYFSFCHLIAKNHFLN